MKKRTVAIALILTSAAAGTVWAFGGHHRDCAMGAMAGMGPKGGAFGGPFDGPFDGRGAGVFPPGKGGPAMMMRLYRELPEEQRAAARELIREGRAEGLELRRQVVNARFELMKIGTAKSWDEQAAAEHSRSLAEAMTALELHRSELRHRMRDLVEQAL